MASRSIIRLGEASRSASEDSKVCAAKIEFCR